MRRAVAFLTVVGAPAAPQRSALPWFPVVGLALGGTLGALWWVTARAWPYTVAAAITVAADLALTGMLHADGLVDSADGLLAHLNRVRRLEVMAEPGVGAFGVLAAGSALILRWASLSAIHPSPVLLAGLWGLSRTGMAVVALTVPYARPAGIASAFIGEGNGQRRGTARRDGPVAIGTGGVAAALGLLLWWNLHAGWAVLAAAALGVAGVVSLAARRIGGFTGDVLGAAGIVGETLGLVVAAARW